MGDERDQREGGTVAGKTFVVRDRRRFDSSGEERDESAPLVASSGPESLASAERVKTSAQAPGRAASPNAVPTGSESFSRASSANSRSDIGSSRQVEGYEAGDSDINFSSFVISLATQALMQLGEMRPPPGINVPLDRESARRTIDILGMLQHKTQSNLTQEEAKLLEEVLHNLRLSYVRAAPAS